MLGNDAFQIIDEREILIDRPQDIDLARSLFLAVIIHKRDLDDLVRQKGQLDQKLRVGHKPFGLYQPERPEIFRRFLEHARPIGPEENRVIFHGSNREKCPHQAVGAMTKDHSW